MAWRRSMPPITATQYADQRRAEAPNTHRSPVVAFLFSWSDDPDPAGRRWGFFILAPAHHHRPLRWSAAGTAVEELLGAFANYPNASSQYAASITSMTGNITPAQASSTISITGVTPRIGSPMIHRFSETTHLGSAHDAVWCDVSSSCTSASS